MRLRHLILLGLPLAMACGGSSSDPNKTYNVALTNRIQTTNPAGDHFDAITLTVTDDNGQVVPSTAIILQVSAGTVVPNNPVTSLAGVATMTWTILSAELTPGQVEGLAYCAPGAGESFCTTNLSGPDKVSFTP